MTIKKRELLKKKTYICSYCDATLKHDEAWKHAQYLCEKRPKGPGRG